MEKAAPVDQTQTELAVFMRQVRENFQAAGQQKSGWLSSLLKKLFA